MMIPALAPALEIPTGLRGLGGDAPLDCEGFWTWNAGAFTEGACWCLKFPWMCSDASYKAAVAMKNPDDFYHLPAPPPVSPPSDWASGVPPASGADADATVNAIIKRQMDEWKAANAEAIRQSVGKLDEVEKPFDWNTVLLVSAVAFGGLVLLKR